jgi:two-component system, chemotaxis family, chemotaxis protein CheY
MVCTQSATPSMRPMMTGALSEIATIRLLLVDDELAALDLGTKLLNRIGFSRVDTATRGSAALTMMREQNYRAVISDWNMPEMSGLQFVQVIRADRDLARIRFIMTSVDGARERVRLALQCGVNAFLLKPFDGQALRSKLSEVLGVPSALLKGRSR